MEERRKLCKLYSKDEIPSSAIEVTSSSGAVSGNVFYIPVSDGGTSTVNATVQMTKPAGWPNVVYYSALLFDHMVYYTNGYSKSGNNTQLYYPWFFRNRAFQIQGSTSYGGTYGEIINVLCDKTPSKTINVETTPIFYWKVESYISSNYTLSDMERVLGRCTVSSGSYPIYVDTES